MLSFLVVVLLCAFLGACIWFLHRTQVRRTVETADRNAPLPALDEGRLPDFQVRRLVETAEHPAPLPIVDEGAVPESDAEEPAHAAPLPTVDDGAVPESDADRTVEEAAHVEPLPTVDDGKLPDFVATPPAVAAAAAAATNDNWLGQIRSLRDSGQLDAALALSRAHFPKTQAFQQAAIILRQQIRAGLDQFQPVDSLLVDLFHTAALADLFRTSTSHKPLDPNAALAAVRDVAFQYAAIGHLRLKLLNKSDVRALEQLWGNPTAHRHVEEVLGEDWLKWCRPSA